MKGKSLSRVQLCDPVDCSPPGSSAHWIFQARVLEWVAISFSRGSSRPRDWTQVSCIVGRRFTIWATREVKTCITVQGTFGFYYLFILTTPHGMWDLSSQTRNWSCAPCIGSRALTIRPYGKYPPPKKKVMKKFILKWHKNDLRKQKS